MSLLLTVYSAQKNEFQLGGLKNVKRWLSFASDKQKIAPVQLIAHSLGYCTLHYFTRCHNRLAK